MAADLIQHGNKTAVGAFSMHPLSVSHHNARERPQKMSLCSLAARTKKTLMQHEDVFTRKNCAQVLSEIQVHIYKM